MKITLRRLIVVLVLLSPALLRAQMNFSQAIVVPDGRTETDSIPVGNNNSYLFAAFAGHSYSIEQSRGLNQPTLPTTGQPTLQMTVFPGCSNFFVPVNDTSAMDPAVNLSTWPAQQRQRLAFVCPGPIFPPAPFNPPASNQAMIMINNTSPAPYAFSLTVTDTTLRSPKWTAGITSDTFWTFTNVSSAAVNISLNALDAFGNSAMFPGLPPPGSSMSIQPGQLVSIDTTQVPQWARTNPPGGPPLVGSVLLAEDGPPGAIQATATIVNNAGPTPTIETVKFEPRR
jgi:hypothetical protein